MHLEKVAKLLDSKDSLASLTHASPVYPLRRWFDIRGRAQVLAPSTPQEYMRWCAIFPPRPPDPVHTHVYDAPSVGKQNVRLRLRPTLL